MTAKFNVEETDLLEVYDRIWRQLDEDRNATCDTYKDLKSLISR